MAFAPDVHAADKYPARPIRIVQGFSAGGVSDTLARIAGEKLGERLGQPIVVEGRPGGGGIVGMTTVAEATPDGYTLLLGQSSITIANSRTDKPRFDPMKEFVPVSMFGTAPSILLAHPSAPVKSVKDLIALIKAKPGTVNCATSGIGTTNDLGVHLFNSMTGGKLVPVPYKGSGPSMTAALGNETPLSFAPLLPAIPHVQNRRLLPLGMSGAKRNQALPDVPTIAEAIPGYEATGFFGIVASRKVPKPLIERLHREFNAVLALPEIQKSFAKHGLETEIMTISQFGEYMERDEKRWSELVRKANLVF
jgi:tripartite-type tricarboxylate transporter receptor subunit TctC